MLGRCMQLGHVVPDMDAALQVWTQTLGVGPFVVLETSKANRTFHHRGSPSDVDFSIAISYVGEVMVEIIMPFNDAPSPYREFLDSGRQGLHHYGFWPDQFESSCDRLAAAGMPEVSSIRHPDGTRDIIYCDAPASLGVMMEIASLTPLRSAFLGSIRQLSAAWDGERPVRRYASREAFIQSGAGR